MVEVTRTFEQLDHLLDSVESSFARLEDYDRRWGELSTDDKDDFLVEWPIIEGKLLKLQELAKQGCVPHRYRGRYRQLQERVTRDRPVLESLWERP